MLEQQKSADHDLVVWSLERINLLHLISSNTVQNRGKTSSPIITLKGSVVYQCNNSQTSFALYCNKSALALI